MSSGSSNSFPGLHTFSSISSEILHSLVTPEYLTPSPSKFHTFWHSDYLTLYLQALDLQHLISYQGITDICCHSIGPSCTVVLRIPLAHPLQFILSTGYWAALFQKSITSNIHDTTPPLRHSIVDYHFVSPPDHIQDPLNPHSTSKPLESLRIIPTTLLCIPCKQA